MKERLTAEGINKERVNLDVVCGQLRAGMETAVIGFEQGILDWPETVVGVRQAIEGALKADLRS